MLLKIGFQDICQAARSTYCVTVCLDSDISTMFVTMNSGCNQIQQQQTEPEVMYIMPVAQRWKHGSIWNTIAGVCNREETTLKSTFTDA